MRLRIVVVLIAFTAATFAQGPGKTAQIEWLKDLRETETWSAAKLTPGEQKEIIDQLESTGFDTPESWQNEVRVRRISLGETEGLLIRGTKLLCGATGNCETWVFRRFAGKWLNLFDGEAPIVSGFGFSSEATGGIRDFYVSSEISAGKEAQIQYKLGGRVYRQSECYEVARDGAAEKVKKAACK